MARPKSDIEPRILAAARARFLNDGVDGASLRGIASDAGTSIGMVYYYFATKDELFFGVVEEQYEKLLRDIEAAITPDVPVRERVERLFVRVARISDDERLMMRLVLREALTSNTRFARLRARFETPVDATDLKAFGTVVKHEGASVTLEVPRAKMVSISASRERVSISSGPSGFGPGCGLQGAFKKPPRSTLTPNVCASGSPHFS